MARPIRTLRHWKQRFNPNARFRFRKLTRWSGDITFQPGDEVPDGLLPPHRLRRFWEAGRIELLEFDEPRDIRQGYNHAEDDPKRAERLGETSVEALGGNWYLIKAGDGREFKERGKRKMQARLDRLAEEFDEAKREEAKRLAEAEAAAEAKAAELDGEGGTSDGADADGDETTDADGETTDTNGETDGGSDETPTDADSAHDEGAATTSPADSEPGSEDGSASADADGDEGAADEAAGGDDSGDEVAAGAEDAAAATESEDGGGQSAIDYNSAAGMPMEALRELGVPHGITDRDKHKLLEKLVAANVVLPPPKGSE